MERSHHHIAWLLTEGKTVREAAEATGYSERWVREVARRYRGRGAEGLGDRRHRDPGGARPAHARAARGAEGGACGGRRAVELPQGGRVDRAQDGAARGEGAKGLWGYLRKLGHTPQVPRPSNADPDPLEREAFRKSSPDG